MWGGGGSGGVIMCAVLHGGGGCNIDFSKWRPEILHEIGYLVFHNYFVSFRKKKNFFRNSRFPIRSVFFINVKKMYRCLLPSSATVKMDYEENMESARYATNDDTPLWTKDWIILWNIFWQKIFKTGITNTSP